MRNLRTLLRRCAASCASLAVVTLWTPCGWAMTSAQPGTGEPHAKTDHAGETKPGGLTLEQADKAYRRAAVDAHVDRVWHAIPGLHGWALDRNASLQKTKAAHDGKLHLVWHDVVPAVRLADLPAEPIYKGPEADRSVCLMFNVSWGEAYIPQLLDTLQKEDVKATFFLDGDWVEKQPKLAREIAQAGHVVGSHGSGHPDFRKLTNEQLTRQMEHSRQVISRVVKRRVDLLAPPAGSYDQRTVSIARQQKMYTILWSDDSVDWMRPSPDRIVGRVMKNVHPGALILMHPTEQTVKALPELIDQLQKQNYAFRTVEDVVRERSAARPPAVLSAGT